MPLAKYHFKEGIRAGMDYARTQDGWRDQAMEYPNCSARLVNVERHSVCLERIRDVGETAVLAHKCGPQHVAGGQWRKALAQDAQGFGRGPRRAGAFICRVLAYSGRSDEDHPVNQKVCVGQVFAHHRVELDEM